MHSVFLKWSQVFKINFYRFTHAACIFNRDHTWMKKLSRKHFLKTLLMFVEKWFKYFVRLKIRIERKSVPLKCPICLKSWHQRQANINIGILYMSGMNKNSTENLSAYFKCRLYNRAPSFVRIYVVCSGNSSRCTLSTFNKFWMVEIFWRIY